MSDASPPPVLERLLRRAGLAPVIETLTERLSWPELQSLLLEVYRRRVGARSPPELLADYERNRFVRPATSDARVLRRLVEVASGRLPAAFEELALSPVTSLGASSVLGPVDQHKVLSTVRNTEVVSDSTNALALECAMRRRSTRGTEARPEVRLAAHHRLLRTQRTGIPGPDPHFQILALATAGRTLGHHRFELEQVREHADIHLDILAALDDEHPDPPAELSLSIRSLDPRLDQRAIDEQICRPLRAKHGRLGKCAVFPIGRPKVDYYRTMSFEIGVRFGTARRTAVANGGALDWTAALLSDQKERFVASGLFFEAWARARRSDG